MSGSVRGWIERHGPSYRARARVGGQTRTLGTYASKAEATSVLRGWTALLASGEAPARGETLRTFGATWLDRREVQRIGDSPSDRSRWRLYVESAPIADVPLAELTRRDVLDWLDRLRGARGARGRRLSAQTVRHVLNLVRRCLADALDRELIERNPAAGTRGPRISRDDGWTYLTPEEQDRLLTCDAIPRAERLIIGFALATGLRQGEQWHLELRDLHVEGDEPHVYVRWGSRGKAPKWGRRRRVPLVGLALRIAIEWLAELQTYARENPLGLVFPTRAGCRRGKKPAGGRVRLCGKLVAVWPRWLAAAGLGPERRHDRRPVRWHDLRHTCASSLVAGWWGRRWSIDEVRDVLGHRSVTTTERYAHLAGSVLAGAAAATTGAPMVLPRPDTPPSQTGEISGRARQDSNLRPTAPEALPECVWCRGPRPPMGAAWEQIRSQAERYVRAVANRSRFAHRYGIELAESVLEATRAERAKGEAG